jgi:hypothetical protein
VSTLLLTISRTELSLSPLVLSGSIDANPLGVRDFVEPARQARVKYAPDSAYQHGSVPLASSWQQSVLGWDVFTDQAATEAASRTLLDSLWAALGQFSFTVTDVVDGAPARIWTCATGSMVPIGPRTLMDLEHHHPVWAVTIPCHPIPGA